MVENSWYARNQLGFLKSMLASGLWKKAQGLVSAYNEN